MKQMIMNYLNILVLPLLVGFAVRMLLNRFRRAYLATAALGIIALLVLCIAQTNPIPGSEWFGILAIQTACTFFASLLTGLLCRLIGKKTKK